MPFTISITKSTAGLETAYTKTDTYTAGAKEAVSEIIPTGVTDELVNFQFNPNSGKIFAVSVTSDYKVTVKTNDINNPDNLFILDSANPFLFTAITGHDGNIISWGTYDSNSEDLMSIDKLYVTNTGLSELTLALDTLYDPTP